MNQTLFKYFSNFFLFIVLSGYFTISILPHLLQTDSRNITIAFRLTTVVLAILLVFVYYSNYHRKLFWPQISLIIFFAIYFIKAVYSFEFLGFEEEFQKSSPDVYAKILGFAIIPSLTLLLIRFQFNYDLIFKIIVFVFLIYFLYAVSGELKFRADGRTNGNLSMYPINFGNYGSSLSLISAFLVMKTKNLKMQILYAIGFLLGLYIIYLSASRTPILSFFIPFITLIFYFIKGKKKWIVSLLAISLLTMIVLIAIHYEGQTNSGFLNRLAKTFTVEGSSGRNLIYDSVIETFLKNPFFGEKILLSNGTFAHNIILESLLATGVFGTLFLLIAFYDIFKNMFTESSDSSYLIYILFFQYFVFSIFAASLYDTSEFWALTALSLTNKRNV